MKTIGLLGGMSWESTATYYRLINEGVKRRLGGLHSAQLVLYSVDFGPIEALQHAGDWAATARLLAQAARSVEAGGADFLLVCTNTMHKVAAEIEEAIEIPLVHIADATADVLLESGIRTVGLLGTAFTMEQDFYTGRLRERFGIDVLVPDRADRQVVHDVIYRELCLGEIRDGSRDRYRSIIDALAARGAEAVILGCTEIGLLVTPACTSVPLIDTTALHAEKAVGLALDGAGPD
ncbi:MAG: aspartate/glutamate racemase family protein [Xanthomonadales bacterium]